jgi:hypothetical protein
MKNLLDIYYYPDLRNEIKKIRSLIASQLLPMSKSRERKIINQIDIRLIESEKHRINLVRKIAMRMDRNAKYMPTSSHLDEFKSSKQAFEQALNNQIEKPNEAIIKHLRIYFKAMHKRKAFYPIRNFDAKFRGYEISFEVIPINSKFAIVQVKEYRQWKSYLNSTTRKAYAMVGLDDFGNSFIIFIPHGLANSIFKSNQVDWKKIQIKIWGCPINYQIGRFGLVKIDGPQDWNYKIFNNVECISPLMIQQLVKIYKINCLKINNDFYKIINPPDEFGKIYPDEIIDQGDLK